MKELIKSYSQSCALVRARIAELTAQRNILKHSGDYRSIRALDLERRIRLLYTEQSQMRDVIEHLSAYVRSVERRAET